jgi:alpha-tubulin suppressor-like RCC1 family protein
VPLSTTSSTQFIQAIGLTSVAQLALGNIHSCAVRTNGAVLCWGANDFGQLARVTTPDAEGYMSSSVAEVVIGISAVEKIASGAFHTCSLDASKNLFCWGSNSSYQLGFECSPTTCQSTVGSSTPIYSRKPIRVLLEPVDDVATAHTGGHTCALSQGKVYCWGANDKGQLGINKISQRESTLSPVFWK